MTTAVSMATRSQVAGQRLRKFASFSAAFHVADVNVCLVVVILECTVFVTSVEGQFVAVGNNSSAGAVNVFPVFTGEPPGFAAQSP